MTTNAVARRQQDVVSDLVERYEGDFATIMPKHVAPETFVGLAIAYVRADKYLPTAVRANPGSLVRALREVAAWGHLPMKGTAALVAYKSKKPADNGWNITAIEEVGGVLQRIYRAGGVTAVHADVVREKDTARFQRTSMALPYHEYDEFADPAERGPLKAVYAYATLLSGQPSTVVWMPRATVMKHRAASKSGDAFWGPAWPDEGPWTEDMWKKTAIHKLSTLVPSSAEYRWQMAASEAAAVASAQKAQEPPHTPGGTWDLEGYAEEAQEPAQGADGACPDCAEAGRSNCPEHSPDRPTP